MAGLDKTLSFEINELSYTSAVETSSTFYIVKLIQISSLGSSSPFYGGLACMHSIEAITQRTLPLSYCYVSPIHAVSFSCFVFVAVVNTT